ncbi:VanZ family protein [Salicibibacter cibarius]|uniref:VanZ family protein n=1 Tax=Salicibibacter cibarius TaxID=2743000 RepID=A0A7T6Z128_9BACI|nr:VanZ family protein [Salicibibacter cibarius]QQK75010.1 VanZ family protein [Salicibibacter cibarius]
MRQRSLRIFSWSMFAIYMAMLLYITAFAWNYGASLGPDGPGGRNYNPVPFRSIYRIGVFSPDIWDPLKILIGNVLLFVPLGIFLPLLFRRLRSIGRVTLVGMLISLFIELYQFTFTMRVSDIDDLVLNTAGVFLGAAMYVSARKVARRIVIILPMGASLSRRNGSISGNSRKR